MEQDIEILEERLKQYKRHLANYEKDNCLTNVYYELKKYAEALEHLIKAYKELEIKLDDKETELQILIDDIKADEIMYKDELSEKYIPVSLVEEKIEEIQKEYEETLKTADFKEIEKMNKINFRGITLEGQRSILQELLEKRK